MPSYPETEMSARGRTDARSTSRVTAGMLQRPHQSPLASERGEAYAHTVSVTHHDSAKRAAVTEAGEQSDISYAREVHGTLTGQRSRGHTRHRTTDQPGFLAQLGQQEGPCESAGQSADDGRAGRNQACQCEQPRHEGRKNQESGDGARKPCPGPGNSRCSLGGVHGSSVRGSYRLPPAGPTSCNRRLRAVPSQSDRTVNRPGFRRAHRFPRQRGRPFLFVKTCSAQQACSLRDSYRRRVGRCCVGAAVCSGACIGSAQHRKVVRR